ncbi:MAG: membrane protein insertase YidC [Chloroflexi bacterium]|nr:membrane protein insertase YidC [Chloroflexota bacterium]
MEIISLLWNEIILNPMQNGLVLLYAFTGQNFGITIIIFTIVVRLITLPLTLKQVRSTKKMSELQPRMAALQRRYGKDRARLSQETMRLYKEAGVNPLGCLGPMVIQLPIWIGLYISITSLLPLRPEDLAKLAGHLYGWLPIVNEVIPLDSRFLWLDLAVPDPSPILAIMVGLSMWVLQKMSTPAAGDPRQQSTNRMLLWMLPVMFAFFTISLPSGLPLYWMISNIIGIVIQYFVTGLTGLWPLFPKQPATAPAVVGVGEAVQTDDQPPASEESAHEEQAGTRGDQRQNGRRGDRSRAQRARRRTRGSHNRGR